MILRFYKIHKKFLPFLSLLIQFHNRINWPINQHQGRTIKEDNNQAEKFIRGSGVSIRGVRGGGGECCRTRCLPIERKISTDFGPFEAC